MWRVTADRDRIAGAAGLVTPMWPWEHLVFGYVLYSLGRHAIRHRSPGGVAVISLALGTQFPDLVDKPLAWWFGVAPSGRSVAHSALVATVVVAVVVWHARRRSRGEVGWAFGIGYATHLVGDSLVPLRYGVYSDLSFLLYPLTPAPVYPGYEGFGPQLSALVAAVSSAEPSFQLAAYLLAFVLAVLLWAFDGTPGAAELLSLVPGR